MKIKDNNKINYKFLLIYSCLILNVNAARPFGSGNSGTNFSSSSSSYGRGLFRIGTNSGLSNEGHSLLRFNAGSSSLSNKPIISISEGKTALHLLSNVGQSSSFSNIGLQSVAKQVAKNIAISSSKTPSALNTQYKQPAYNPYFNPPAKLPISTIDAVNPVLAKQPAYNPYYNSERKDHIPGKTADNKYPQQPAYNPYYNVGMNVFPTFAATNYAFNAPSNQPNYNTFNKGSNLNGNKTSSILSDFFKGWSMMPSKSPNSLFANKIVTTRKTSPFGLLSNTERSEKSNATNSMTKNGSIVPPNLSASPVDFINSFPHFDALNLMGNKQDEKISCKKDFEAARVLHKSLSGNRALKYTSLLGLKGYTIPTIYRHNLLKSQQRHRGFQNQKPTFAKTQIIVMITLAVFIISTISVIFYIKLTK